ncbi:hypothetical protein [Subtercola sp. YIM 133946]|uniref:hypothetical protein n=1 Tax=Subtercola sp. YIM 133946 TaxID=3118909 RepID=UPI002F95572D
MSSEYYDRAGQPISRDEWVETFDTDKMVAKTTVGNSDVSTVYLGLNHSWGDGPPLIFESMIFGGARDQDQYRYSTEEQALAGHQKLVDELEAERSAVARHVLWHFGDRAHGQQPGHFLAALMTAYGLADSGNREKLRATFPDYGTAMDSVMNEPDGAQKLVEVAGVFL